MKNSLSKPTILFHWITGLAFLGTLALGLYLEDLPKGAEKMEIMGLHKSIGVIVFFIAVLRLMWRYKEGMINSVANLSKFQSIAARLTHYLLLVATILMPLSGILMSIGGGRAINIFSLELIAAGDKIEWLGSISNTIHTGSVNIVIIALLLHFLGALKHQFIDKDGTLSRMLGNFHKH